MAQHMGQFPEGVAYYYIQNRQVYGDCLRPLPGVSHVYVVTNGINVLVGGGDRQEVTLPIYLRLPREASFTLSDVADHHLGLPFAFPRPGNALNYHTVVYPGNYTTQLRVPLDCHRVAGYHPCYQAGLALLTVTSYYGRRIPLVELGSYEELQNQLPPWFPPPFEPAPMRYPFARYLGPATATAAQPASSANPAASLSSSVSVTRLPRATRTVAAAAATTVTTAVTTTATATLYAGPSFNVRVNDRFNLDLLASAAAQDPPRSPLIGAAGSLRTGLHQRRLQRRQADRDAQAAQAVRRAWDSELTPPAEPTGRRVRIISPPRTTDAAPVAANAGLRRRLLVRYQEEQARPANGHSNGLNGDASRPVSPQPGRVVAALGDRLLARARLFAPPVTTAAAAAPLQLPQPIPSGQNGAPLYEPISPPPLPVRARAQAQQQQPPADVQREDVEDPREAAEDAE